MKKILITGGSGFVGSHLIEYLHANQSHQIFTTTFGHSPSIVASLVPKPQIFKLNLLNKADIAAVVKKIIPDEVVHLAALSSASQSFSQADKTITNNTSAQINLLDALIQLKHKPKTLIIGSAEEYGIVKKSETPVTESNPFRPISPYAVSKIAQDFLGFQYHLTYGLPVVRLRPFNHTGERRPPNFVIPAFAKQIAEIEAGKKDHMMIVGDLSVVRDFTDVKDMVIAYDLALKHCKPGEVYNIGSGRPVKISTLLEILLQLTPATITVKKDPSQFRPADVKVLVCDATKFKKQTGWEPKIPLETTIKRVLNYWRKEIA